MHKSVVDLVDDLMVHRAAELRMRMQHDGERCIFLRRRVIAGFDSAGRSGEDDFRHELSTLDQRWSAAAQDGVLDGTDGRT